MSDDEEQPPFPLPSNPLERIFTKTNLLLQAAISAIRTGNDQNKEILAQLAMISSQAQNGHGISLVAAERLKGLQQRTKEIADEQRKFREQFGKALLKIELIGKDVSEARGDIEEISDHQIPLPTKAELDRADREMAANRELALTPAMAWKGIKWVGKKWPHFLTAGGAISVWHAVTRWLVHW